MLANEAIATAAVVASGTNKIGITTDPMGREQIFQTMTPPPEKTIGPFNPGDYKDFNGFCGPPLLVYAKLWPWGHSPEVLLAGLRLSVVGSRSN